MEPRPFSFNNVKIVLRIDYGAAVKLKTTYTGEVSLTLTSITALRFDFVLKKLYCGQRVMVARADLQ